MANPSQSSAEDQYATPYDQERLERSEHIYVPGSGHYKAVMLFGWDGKAGAAQPVERYSGGKSAAVFTITSSGNTTVITPASGKRIRVFWVSYVPSSDNSNANLVKVGFGTASGSIDSGQEFYRGFVVSHWEPFTGAVDKSVIVNTATAEAINGTIHYQEIT